MHRTPCCTYTPFTANQAASKPTWFLIASSEGSMLERKSSQEPVLRLLHNGKSRRSILIREVIAAPPALMVRTEIITRYCRIRSPGVYRGSPWPQRHIMDVRRNMAGQINKICACPEVSPVLLTFKLTLLLSLISQLQREPPES